MKGKNLIKRVLSFVAAIAMTLGLMGASVVPAFAATDGETATYTITVTNQSTTTQTLSGNTFSAYKLFDVTYSGSQDTDPHAYTISTSNYFYTNTTAKGVLDQYFTFTASASDPTVMTVTVKSTAGPSNDGSYYDSTKKTLTDAGARALADALQSSLTGATATSTTTAGSDATNVVIDVTQGNHYINSSNNSTEITNGGPGYYIITGSVDAADEGTESEKVIAAVGLTTTDPKREIQVKADVPTLEKEITTTSHDGNTITADDGITDTNGVSTTANVGDKISYKLTSVVPLMTDYTSYTFKIQDTLSSGLTFDANSVKVYIYKANADDSNKFDNLTYGETVTLSTSQDAKAEYGTTTSGAFTVTTADGTNGAHVVTIEFQNFIRLLAYNGYNIEVTYDATLNNNALSTNAETNTAQLTYSNDPYGTGTGTTTEKKTYVYDFDLVLDKWTGTDPNYTSLQNAKFVLYKRGTEQATAPSSGDYDTVTTGEAPNTTTTYYPRLYYKVDASTNVVTWAAGAQADASVVTTDANGSAKFTGLEAGTYYLLETEAPNGYNKLTEATPVTVTASYDSTTHQLKNFSSEGNTVNTGAAYSNKAGTQLTPTNKQNVITQIENKAGSLLPSTGGIGTTIFYVLGGCLVAAAAVILIVRRRRNA